MPVSCYYLFSLHLYLAIAVAHLCVFHIVPDSQAVLLSLDVAVSHTFFYLSLAMPSTQMVVCCSPNCIFRPSDLYEKRVSYPKAIVNCIHALARHAKTIASFKGPEIQVIHVKGKSSF